MPYIDPSTPIPDVSTCTKCGLEKSNSDFYSDKTLRVNKKTGELKRRGKRNGRSSWCKSCDKNKSSVWRKANPDQAKSNLIKSNYGITRSQYDQMIVDQLGRCSICEKPTQKFYVDHCHVTGEVRDLLCVRCNIGLGGFQDNPESLKNAGEYIMRHRLNPRNLTVPPRLRKRSVAARQVPSSLSIRRGEHL